MIIKFLHSKSKEVEKLLDIYDEYDWFVDNKFPIKLPKFYVKLYKKYKNNKKLFTQELESKLNIVYKPSVYLINVLKVKNSWQRTEPKFFSTIKDLDIEVSGGYVCNISLYGPEGRFKLPNIIDLRIASSKDVKDANETIAHELIHLMINSKAKKLKLNYQEVEGVVDMFFTDTNLSNIFQKYKLQSIANHSKKIFSELIKTKK